MAEPAAPRPRDASWRDASWRAVLTLVAALTLVRLVGIFSTPLDLYPDEAQYWLWSRTLDFGYYSKPPMIAWVIWLTTALGGDSEPFVRLAAPFFHAGTTLAVFAVGKRLHGAETGFAAAALYALMPGVQLNSVTIATDAPLLFFLGLNLLAYVHLQDARGRRRLWLAAGFGASLGLAFLSKYAAVYALIGLALHLVLSRSARSAWTPASIAAAAAAGLVILAPNLAWNAAHGFSTLEHTAANANWNPGAMFNAGELAEFLGSQFGIFGPIPFAVLIGGAVVLARRGRMTEADRLLAAFALPVFAIVAAQAFISRANANWTSAGYVAGVVLVAAWLMRWRAKWWLVGAIASQALLAAAFLTFAVSPKLGEQAGVANSFKRAKGWEAMTRQVIDRAETEADRGLTAVAVNDRFLFNAAAYYGRRYFGLAGAPPLVMWVREARPQNQAEATRPLTPANGERVLAVALDQIFRDEMAADFRAVSGREIASVRLDAERRRRAEMFIGEGFAPRPRDPTTGLPTPP